MSSDAPQRDTAILDFLTWVTCAQSAIREKSFHGLLDARHAWNEVQLAFQQAWNLALLLKINPPAEPILPQAHRGSMSDESAVRRQIAEMITELRKLYEWGHSLLGGKGRTGRKRRGKRKTQRQSKAIPKQSDQSAPLSQTPKKKPRPSAERDQILLQWYEAEGQPTYHSPATIRDKARQERPEWRITVGDSGRHQVTKAIQRARAERDS